MSNKTYYDMLNNAINNLKSLEQEENKAQEEAKNNNYYENQIRLYLKYLLIFQQLEECYDAIIQSQIRIEIKKTMEYVICKIVEIRYNRQFYESSQDFEKNKKNEALLKIMKEMNSFHNFKICVPRYFKEDHKKQQMIRDSIIQEYKKLNIEQQDSEPEQLMNVNESDKAPNSLNITNISSEINVPDDDSSMTVDNGNDNTNNNLNQKDALLKLQKIAKQFISKIKKEKYDEEERFFLGMQDPNKSSTNRKDDTMENIRSKLSNAYSKRKQDQMCNNEEFQKVLMEVKYEILEEEGFEMNEKLREERFQWIADEITTKKSIPENVQGFYEDDTSAKEDLDQNTLTKSSSDKKTPQAAQEKKGFDDKAYQLFSTKKDLFHSQNYDRDLAKKMIVRDQVHELITKEVDNSIADHLKKVKELSETTGDVKKGKKKAGKKSKKGKSKKGKKEKPLPGAKILEINKMDTDHMLSILIEQKIVTDVRKNTKLDHFESEDIIIHPDLVNKQSPPLNHSSLAELRSMINEFCVLPQGSTSIKKQLDPKCNSRSIVFYGPQGSGKSLMVEAVAAELGALFINLSPKTLQGKYTDKAGPTTLIHMIFAVAKDPAYAPVVIHIDSCEEFFQSTKGKKGKLVDKSGPVRFQKDLLIYKNQALSSLDRVIVIGTTKYPEKADWKLLSWKGATGKVEKQGFFEMFLHFPYPNYFDRVKIWKMFVHACLEENSMTCGSKNKYHQQESKIDCGALAKFSEGHTAGDIHKCIQDTCGENNNCFSSNQLTERTFLSNLLSKDNDLSEYVEDMSRFNDFSKKVFAMCESKKPH